MSSTAERAGSKVDFNFAGKSVLVTGGTSGIGRAIAEAYCHSGAHVVAAGLPSNETALPEIQTQLLEITDDLAIRRLVDTLSTIDVLVNAAGVIRRDAEFELETFAQVLDINLTGVMRASMAARPKLLASRGCIVNIASMLSFFGAPRAPAYSASKGAVAQLTKSLAAAWASDGVRVNAVAPGWIATSLTAALREDPLRSAQLLSRTPLGRWGRPEEIAGPVLFLSSEAASFITGAILPVDGGYLAA